MADDDRIREFLKLSKQAKDDPKRIAAVIRKWMASDVPAHKKTKKVGVYHGRRTHSHSENMVVDRHLILFNARH